MYGCMDEWKYGCMGVLSVCMLACMHARKYVRTHVCTHACLHVCMFARLHVMSWNET